MKKIILLLTIIVLAGYGCSNPQQNIVEQQQKQIDELNHKIEEISQEEETKDDQEENINLKQQDVTPHITQTAEEVTPPQIIIEKNDSTKLDDYIVFYDEKGNPITWTALDSISMILKDTLDTYRESLPTIIQKRDVGQTSIGKGYSLLIELDDEDNRLLTSTLISYQEAQVVTANNLITFLKDSISNYENLLETIQNRDQVMYKYYSKKSTELDQQKENIIDEYANAEKKAMDFAKQSVIQSSTPTPEPTPTTVPTPTPEPAPTPVYLLPPYSEFQMSSKFNSLLYVNNITSQSVIFQRSGPLTSWDNAKVVFNGQTILTKDGNEITSTLDTGETYAPHSRDWVGIINLNPDTDYYYQIVYPKSGREDSTLNGHFKTLPASPATE